MSGVELIAAERKRQIEVEGWTADHDDQHFYFEMANASICYINHAANPCEGEGCKRGWPWHWRWWKPGTAIRDLVKAGALIAAEIDRLERLENEKAGQGGGVLNDG